MIVQTILTNVHVKQCLYVTERRGDDEILKRENRLTHKYQIMQKSFDFCSDIKHAKGHNFP